MNSAKAAGWDRNGECEDLLAAAWEVLRENGYAGFTLEAVARQEEPAARSSPAAGPAGTIW